MPENALALGITVPKIEPNTGFVNSLLAASQIKSSESSNALHQMQLEKFRTNQNALLDYNTRLNAGDPDADKALSVAPDIQHQVMQNQSLKTDEARKHTVWSTLENANAARRVLALPPGPERDAAWSAELQQGLRDKRISAETYQAGYGKPANELLLRNAMENGLTIEEQIKLQERRTDRATGTRVMDDLIQGIRNRNGGTPVSSTEPPPGERVSSGTGSSLGGIPGMGDRPEIVSYPGMPAAAPAAPRVAQAAPAAAPIDPNAPPPPADTAMAQAQLFDPKKPIGQNDLIPLFAAAAGTVGVPESVQKVALEFLKNEFKSDEKIREVQQRLKIADHFGLPMDAIPTKNYILNGTHDDKWGERADQLDRLGIDRDSPEGVKFSLTGEFNNDVKRRAKDADEYGLTKGTPEHAAYVLKGDFPIESRQREYTMKVAGIDPMSPVGKKYMATGHLDIDADRRREELKAAGASTTDDNALRFIFTGKWPGEDKPSRATEAAIHTAEQKIGTLNNGFKRLNEIALINPLAFSAGMSASRGRIIADWVPEMLVSDKTLTGAKATVAMSQLRNDAAIKEMSSTMKGSTTDKEMGKWLDNAANQNNSVEQRHTDLKRAQAEIVGEMLREQDYIDQVREKTYTKPQGGRQRLSDIDTKAIEEFLGSKRDTAEFAKFDRAFGRGTAETINRMFR